MADENQANDILWGATAIARAAGLPDRNAAYHLLEAGHLPAQKVGRKWVSSRTLLRQALAPERGGSSV
jgi:hypothetical protein